MKERIVTLLEKRGPMTAAQLADALYQEESHIRKHANDLAKTGRIARLDLGLPKRAWTYVHCKERAA